MRSHAEVTRRFAVAASVALASVSMWSLPAPAKACDCASIYAYLVWPRDGAVDVPRDTPIVIERQNFYGPTSALQPVLEDDEGNAIELEEVRVLPSLGVACFFPETVFLRPTAPLAAGARFTLRIEADHSDPDAGVPEDFESRTTDFSVGEGMFEPSSEDPSVTYLNVGGTSECTEEPCELAEVLVELGEEASMPYWLEVDSNAERDNATRGMVALSFDPRLRDSVQVSVMVPSTDRCVHLALYALDGTALVDEERCAPDECALSDSWTYSDCGGPPSTSLDSRLVRGTSCEDPEVFDPMASDAGTHDAGIHDAAVHDAGDEEEPRPTLDAGDIRVPETDASIDESSGGGCSCSVRRGASSLDAGIWLALLVLLRRRSRR